MVLLGKWQANEWRMSIKMSFLSTRTKKRKEHKHTPQKTWTNIFKLTREKTSRNSQLKMHLLSINENALNTPRTWEMLVTNIERRQNNPESINDIRKKQNHENQQLPLHSKSKAYFHNRRKSDLKGYSHGLKY